MLVRICICVCMPLWCGGQRGPDAQFNCIHELPTLRLVYKVTRIQGLIDVDLFVKLIIVDK